MDVVINAQGAAPRTRPSSRGYGLRIALLVIALTSLVSAQPALPELTAPVNDFANVIDANNSVTIDKMIRALKAASGDVVVVATVPDIDGYADIREFATKLFENRGKGIGDKGKDNGVLIVLAMKERQVRVEVGYDLEQWVTDGFAGETSRLVMAPHFRQGDYGAGLSAGTARIISRIAQGRGVTLQGVPVAREPEQQGTPVPMAVMLLIFFAILMMGRIGRGGPRGLRRGGGWSGWSSGVGPFGGGGFGGGFGGGGGGFGGGGGGFGGFGGGRSGGGGGGAGW